MRQFRARSEIIFKVIIFLDVKLILTNIYQINNKTISDVLHEILQLIIFYISNKGINL